ncbi:hypothetical protein BB561_006380 [Smittium simulii]|uniref:BAH domain-containing protein n=1 Tax=Smittium simulii TaxID=133385 RepID=A0A2T9Y4S0_9FUNG|nr:hypothetical protein BB561_006380 [Smittium simulii]
MSLDIPLQNVTPRHSDSQEFTGSSSETSISQQSASKLRNNSQPYSSSRCQSRNRSKSDKINTEGLDFLDSLTFTVKSCNLEDSIQPGDFALFTNHQNQLGPLVGHIYNIWQKTENSNEKGVFVCWFFHPWQTKHKISKMFYQNEVFKTTGVQSIPETDIISKCYVVEPKSYSQGYPKSINKTLPEFEKLVFVCDSRYCENSKKIIPIRNINSIWPPNISKIDILQKNEIEHYHDGPKVLIKVPSVFAENYSLLYPRNTKISQSSTPSSIKLSKDALSSDSLSESHNSASVETLIGSQDSSKMKSAALKPTLAQNINDGNKYSFYHNFSLNDSVLDPRPSKTPRKSKLDVSKINFTTPRNKESKKMTQNPYYSTRSSRPVNSNQQSNNTQDYNPLNMTPKNLSITQPQDYHSLDSAYNQNQSLIGHSSIPLQKAQSTNFSLPEESNYTSKASDIDPDIVSLFRTDKLGKILWFATPPTVPPIVDKPP